MSYSPRAVALALLVGLVVPAASHAAPIALTSGHATFNTAANLFVVSLEGEGFRAHGNSFIDQVTRGCTAGVNCVPGVTSAVQIHASTMVVDLMVINHVDYTGGFPGDFISLVITFAPVVLPAFPSGATPATQVSLDLIGQYSGTAQGTTNQVPLQSDSVTFSGTLAGVATLRPTLLGLQLFEWDMRSIDATVQTPEPSTWMLLGTGVLALITKRRGFGDKAMDVLSVVIK